MKTHESSCLSRSKFSIFQLLGDSIPPGHCPWTQSGTEESRTSEEDPTTESVITGKVTWMIHLSDLLLIRSETSNAIQFYQTEYVLEQEYFPVNHALLFMIKLETIKRV